MHRQVDSECQQRMVWWMETPYPPHARWCLGNKTHLATVPWEPCPFPCCPVLQAPMVTSAAPTVTSAPLVQHGCAARWGDWGPVPSPGTTPCHICVGVWDSICCGGRGSRAVLPQWVTKSQGSKSSCHFLLVKEDPVPPVPASLPWWD